MNKPALFDPKQFYSEHESAANPEQCYKVLNMDEDPSDDC